MDAAESLRGVGTGTDEALARWCSQSRQSGVGSERSLSLLSITPIMAAADPKINKPDLDKLTRHRVKWTVLAPGPSLERMLGVEVQEGRYTLAPGPVVAVNSAILTADRFGVRVSFWCCVDRPELHRQSLKVLKRAIQRGEFEQHPVVWCQCSSHLLWEKEGYAIWPHPTAEVYFRQACFANGRQGHERKARFGNLSILTAVTRVVGLGVKNVDVLGVDMAGEGYADGVDMKQRNEKQWRTRWEEEKNRWRVACEEWKEAGCEVVRVMPKGRVK